MRKSNTLTKICINRHEQKDVPHNRLLPREDLKLCPRKGASAGKQQTYLVGF